MALSGKAMPSRDSMTTDSRFTGCMLAMASCRRHQHRRDPPVGLAESLLQRCGRLPLKDRAQSSIVRVPSSNALRLAQIMTAADSLPCRARDDIDELVDRHQTIRAKVEWLP